MINSSTRSIASHPIPSWVLKTETCYTASRIIPLAPFPSVATPSICSFPLYGVCKQEKADHNGNGRHSRQYQEEPSEEIQHPCGTLCVPVLAVLVLVLVVLVLVLAVAVVVVVVVVVGGRDAIQQQSGFRIGNGARWRRSTVLFRQAENDNLGHGPGAHPIEPTLKGVEGTAVVVADVVLVAVQFLSPGIVVEKVGGPVQLQDKQEKVLVPVDDGRNDLRKAPNGVVAVVLDRVPEIVFGGHVPRGIPCRCRSPNHPGKIGQSHAGQGKGDSHVVAPGQSELLEQHEPLPKHIGKDRASNVDASRRPVEDPVPVGLANARSGDPRGLPSPEKRSDHLDRRENESNGAQRQVGTHGEFPEVAVSQSRKDRLPCFANPIAVDHGIVRPNHHKDEEEKQSDSPGQPTYTGCCNRCRCRCRCHTECR
mmetsp:Transcript_2296/g.5248  ORF Transcript_2296/g.5248 Transcript_2296/m.5248 type:complete len:423 (+) Transcript_2296:216-1484(+)